MKANCTQPFDPDAPAYTPTAEWRAYDELPDAIKQVIRDAPFEVSAADIVNNWAVMKALQDRGADAPTWLAEQLSLTYRNKICASS